MTELLLIRHGETDWNLEGRWQGQEDVPLNAHGAAQAAALAAQLRGIRVASLYSSDLQRARRTAEILAEAYSAPVILEPRLREVHQGEWQGILIHEIQQRYERQYLQRVQDPWNVAPPGGETAAQVLGRALPVVEAIARRHPGQTVAIVTHGFLIAVLVAHQQRAPGEQLWKLIPGHCQPVTIQIPDQPVDQAEECTGARQGSASDGDQRGLEWNPAGSVG